MNDTQPTIQDLLVRMDQFEHLLVVNRDHPKEETFSRKMYDVEMKLVNVHEKLDAILQQTTKTNGRVSRLEDDNILSKERISSHGKILGFGGTTVGGIVLTAILMTIIK